jgi:hypothetical protein
MRARIETFFAAQAPAPLVKALLDAYAELKDNFNFERFRPSELEGAASRKPRYGSANTWRRDHTIP